MAHPQVRQRDIFHKHLWMTKGPRQMEKNLLVIWGPFEDEMLNLRKGEVGGGEEFIVYDAFLKKTYKLTVVLGLVYADSIMRITMGRFMGIGSYRADPYSLFEGTVGPGGRGMYFRGYHEKVQQQAWHTASGESTVWANDPEAMITKEMHRALVAKTESGVEPPHATGRHGRGALERISYFDPMRGYAHPFGHCVFYGIVKKFIKLLMGKVKSNTHPHLVLPAAVVDEMKRRAALIQPPHDVIRPYHCVVQYVGKFPLLDPGVRGTPQQCTGEGYKGRV